MSRLELNMKKFASLFTSVDFMYLLLDVTSSFRHLIPLSCEWLFSFMQFNALITSARQREESSQHSYSGGSHPVFHPSGSLTSNSYRQSWSPFSQNPSMYGGTNAQGPASARLTRILDLEMCTDTLVGAEMRTDPILFFKVVMKEAKL
ncbi:hypothetical protein RHMOL_Rhmol02G0158000 [Rhododendron molle]|uniref:Uncharacterized protein n=1 Tax=Rhododendron molle TaxID=49168 RepID=A0ACC0PQP0_RHOML|nr:hypothetical protein RHMOL_Rhmol02G0158000 [Rhododendron molle]